MTDQIVQEVQIALIIDLSADTSLSLVGDVWLPSQGAGASVSILYLIHSQIILGYRNRHSYVLGYLYTQNYFY